MSPGQVPDTSLNQAVSWTAGSAKSATLLKYKARKPTLSNSGCSASTMTDRTEDVGSRRRTRPRAYTCNLRQDSRLASPLALSPAQTLESLSRCGRTPMTSESLPRTTAKKGTTNLAEDSGKSNTSSRFSMTKESICATPSVVRKIMKSRYFFFRYFFLAFFVFYFRSARLRA
jgi:hypothetical protein